MRLRLQLSSVAIAALAGAIVVHADWTAVASTGVVDEGDLGKIVLDNDGSARIRPTVASTSAKLRFNVVDVTGIGTPPPDAIAGDLLFAMRVLDNGPGARVIATLKRVTLAGFYPHLPQTTIVLATIDSDLAPGSNAWQTVWARWSVRARGLEFLDHGFVVEVQLIKHDATGNPGVMGVQLIRDET